jgi:hypothetical protein
MKNKLPAATRTSSIASKPDTMSGSQHFGPGCYFRNCLLADTLDKFHKEQIAAHILYNIEPPHFGHDVRRKNHDDDGPSWTPPA